MTSETPADPICPWCSAVLPDPEVITCPSCGAALHEQAPVEIPGLTAIDPALIRRTSAPRRRRRTFGWLSKVVLGDDALDDVELTEPGAGPPIVEAASGPEAVAVLAPPSGAVREEMRRIELEALAAVAGTSLEADEVPDEVADDAAEPGATDSGEVDPSI